MFMLRSLCLFALLAACGPVHAEEGEDPDVPAFAKRLGINKEDYLRARGVEIGLRRGITKDEPYDVTRRIEALNQLEAQERALPPALSSYRWTSLGPEPIPNGQTTAVSTAVSGRTIAIAVHPTNPNIVYSGTANGGLYRTLDGGATWRAMTDSIASLAIGAVTIDPSNPTTVWIGTGEGNGSADSFAGVGIYRILNAESASPTIEGPFATRVAGCGSSVDNGIAFTGTSITRIVFDPNNASRMFVGNSTGVAGIGVGVGLGGTNGRIGLWLSGNANAANPTFSLCIGGGTLAVKDIAFEPGSSNNMVYHVVDRSGGTAHGVYQTTNAASATISPSASFTTARTLDLSTLSTSAANGELAINRVGAVTTVVSAHGQGNGAVQVSTNGGATWGTAITSANGYCGGQCFYDIAVAIDPTDSNRIYIGGSATATNTRIFARATTGTNFAASEGGLHADTHAIAIAPSNPAIIYTGNDGGIFRSSNNGATWTSLNVAGYNATQFMSLATHASDPEFMIGGTQDNGTELKRTDGTWTRTDFGDGGFAQIDQSSTSTATIRMYHTYFNSTASPLIGYATQTSPTAFENWTFRGCNGTTGNNIVCTGAVRFYAPMALGPGTPNPVYFGADRLYRSTNAGSSHTVVSQAPIVTGVPIASIGISPSNDNVRIVGLNDGSIFATSTGSATLTNVDQSNNVPNVIVARAAVDRNNNDIAYVTLSGFTTSGQIWKTTNLSGGATTTWTNASAGIPNIPVNAFVIDPRNSNHLYAGTDIGVYRSTNGGTSWTAFSTGLPRTPVFDMAFQAATLTSGQHTLRIATHGRGIWEIGIQSPPNATTGIASNVTRTSATLNGIVNDNLFSTSVTFEYGTTMAYGTTVAATPGTVNSNSDTAVSAALTGLTPDTLYHFRVVATNSVGTTRGVNGTFFTNSLGFQVGQVTLGATRQAEFNRVTRVNFAQRFGATPVVVAQVSNADPDPTAVRVLNVSASGFDLLQVEAPGCTGCNGANGTSTVNWIASSQGTFRIPNTLGGEIEVRAGLVNTNANQRNTASGFAGWPATNWANVSFPPSAERFLTAPIVLSGLQTWANEGSNLTLAGSDSQLAGTSQPWATTVVRNITTAGFDVAIESSEVDDDDLAPAGFANNETIGYIAIESGVSGRIANFAGGAAVGIATGTGTATDSCTNSDLSFPAATPITVSALRAISGKQSRSDADGGWLRLCALSNPSGTVVRAQVRVDEDADLDAERAHATAEAVGTAIFGGDLATTPVTLSWLSSRRNGSSLEVEFQVANEVAHVGYRIWGRASEQDAWRPLHAELLVHERGDSHRAMRYRRVLDAPGVTEIRIEDVDMLGQSRFHTPVAAGAASGSEVSDVLLDWSAIRASHSQTRIPDVRDRVRPAVLARVGRAGVQRVSISDLMAQGLALERGDLHRLAVVDGQQAVARALDCPDFPAQCHLEWLGQIRQSLYGPERVYRIELDAQRALIAGPGAVRELGLAARSLPGRFEHAPNRRYSFSAPGTDPWYDERILAQGAPVTVERSFRLPGRAEGPVELELKLWGGLDFPGEAPDHSVVVLLNGVELDRRRFDGLGAQSIMLTLPNSLLQEQNTLSVRLPSDTGYPADLVLLDGFTVNYPRYSQSHDGFIEANVFESPVRADVISGGGFETRSGFTLEHASGDAVLWTQSHGVVRRDRIRHTVAVDPGTQALLLADWSKAARPTLAAAPAPAVPSAVDYLIITHPLFVDALAPLVELQQARGMSVNVVRTDQIYAGADDRFDPQTIAQFISDSNPRFVLLAGGDSYDYGDYLGLGSMSFIPTFYRPSGPVVRFAASDHPMIDIDGDGRPERALGRIPARTVVEMERAVASIVARGNQAATRYFGTASASAPGEQFATHAKTLLSYLRTGQTTRFGLVDEIGLDPARSETRAALSGSSDWINYLGHSSPNRWAFQNVLDTQQLASIQRTGLPAIVSQWGCWNNYFVLPEQDTMAHALMLRNNSLASVVIGSSGLAEDSSHLALGTRFFDLVEDGRFGDEQGTTNTIGEALMHAKRRLLHDAPEHVDSVYSMSLFGDPATPLR